MIKIKKLVQIQMKKRRTRVKKEIEKTQILRLT